MFLLDRSSPASPIPILSKPAVELTSIPAWWSLKIALPVTGSRQLEDTAPEGLSSPHTNALAASALKVGRSSWANARNANARRTIVIAGSVCIVVSLQCDPVGSTRRLAEITDLREPAAERRPKFSSRQTNSSPRSSEVFAVLGIDAGMAQSLRKDCHFCQ